MRDGNDGEIEFAAYIGIDWADQKHACALQSSTESGVVQGELIHKPEAVEAWATDLYRRFGGRPIAIALEQSRGSLLFMLLKYEHLVLFPVHPSTLVNYRKGFRPSGAKNDPSDATLLVDLLVLLCYKRRVQQKGQCGSWVRRERAILIRRVAIEVGLCRSARTRRTARLEVGRRLRGA